MTVLEAARKIGVPFNRIRPNRLALPLKEYLRTKGVRRMIIDCHAILENAYDPYTCCAQTPVQRWAHPPALPIRVYPPTWDRVIEVRDVNPDSREKTNCEGIRLHEIKDRCDVFFFPKDETLEPRLLRPLSRYEAKRWARKIRQTRDLVCRPVAK